MKQLEKLNLELNFFLALAHKHLGFFMHDRSTAGLFFRHRLFWSMTCPGWSSERWRLQAPWWGVRRIYRPWHSKAPGLWEVVSTACLTYASARKSSHFWYPLAGTVHIGSWATAREGSTSNARAPMWVLEALWEVLAGEVDMPWGLWLLCLCYV